MSVLPEGYELTDDQGRIDPVAAQAYLTRSYWSPGIELALVKRAIEGSFCVAVLHQNTQIAMARLVTDKASFAYLCDVYVLEEHRGLGLASAMLAFLHTHPDLQEIRRWALLTRDAQAVYKKSGWWTITHPERMMLRGTPEEFP